MTDRDDSPPKPPKYQKHIDDWQARGCAAWATSKRELENYIHLSVLTTMIPGYNGTGADFDDVPLLVAEAIHNADPCAGSWSAVSPENKKSKVSRAKTRLNNEVAKQMTPALLTLVDSTDELRQYLRAVGLALEK